MTKTRRAGKRALRYLGCFLLAAYCLLPTAYCPQSGETTVLRAPAALPTTCVPGSTVNFKGTLYWNTNTSPGTCQWVSSNSVWNVKDFGAVGNGIVDDSAAINFTIALGGGGKIIFPPGTHNIASTGIVVHVSISELDGQNATLLCNVGAKCVQLADASNPTHYNKIHFHGFKIEPGTGSSSYSAIADNGQWNTIAQIEFSANGANRFANGIENDDDQNERLEDISIDAAPIFVCTASFCGSAYYAPGPYSSNAGITLLINPGFNLGCSGNGVNYQDANGLTIIGGYIQGYSQFAVRSNASTTQIDLHEERGNCSNPIGNIGAAGNIELGNRLTSIGMSPSALAVAFTVNGTAGTTNYVYWIVATESSTGRISNPLPIGYVRTGNATIDGTNSVTATWPASSVSGISGATYKLIRKVQDLAPPTGTGNWLVASGLDEATYCSAGVCTFTDTVTNPSSFTPVTASSSIFSPSITFWPGNVTLSPGGVDNCATSASYDGVAFSSGGTLTNACPYSLGKVNYFSGTLAYGGDYQPMAFTYYWSPTSTNQPLMFTVQHPISFTMGDINNSSELSTSEVKFITAPTACTIKGWNILVDAGTITIKFWKKATGTAIPTSGDSISTSGISLSTGTAVHSATLTDFSTASIAANDILAAAVYAESGVHYANVVLDCQ